jgi:starch synthase (maltosyl-transferring)
VTPIIYNLFPTLAGPVDTWPAHARRAERMAFNWLYVNPHSYPGFSGSLYAVKEHDRLHPALEPARPRAGGATGLAALAAALESIRKLGLGVMTDLVVNHTSRDCPLVESHRGWFRLEPDGQVRSPRAIDPADARNVTVWGDLAEIDNESSADRDALWAFWEERVDRALDLGFTGFRGDAAYKVPGELWRRLIARARAREPRALFVAETLGCRLEEMAALAGVGFDYFYDSAKWWDLQAPWFLEQHAWLRDKAPTISFPESHDTPRLAAESGGSEAVQRQRYALAALLAAGVQMTVGYELGFRRQLDVVRTRPADWETPSFDLRPFVRRVNRLKAELPLLQGQGVLRALGADAPDVTLLSRWSDPAGTHRGVIAVNRSLEAAREVTVDVAELPGEPRLFRVCVERMPARGVPVPERLRLEPAEVALLAAPPR